MIVCTVHEPRDAPADRLDRAASLEFVRDGFSFVAAAFAPAWLLANRIWLPLLGYIAVVVVLGAVAAMLGSGEGWALLLLIAMHLAVGFEASSLRRWALERRGWTALGTVAGRNTEECERRFFDDWLRATPFLSGAALTSGSGGLASAAGGLADGGGRREYGRTGNLWSRRGWRSPARKT